MGSIPFASEQVRRVVELARKLAVIQDRTPSEVLYRCGAFGGTYERLVAGSDLHTATAERLIRNMRDKWPAGVSE